MDVTKLDEEVSAAVGAAWSTNTLSTRNSQWKKYLKFCSDIDQIPLPADIQTIVRFLVFLARGCKYSTINNYLSAVIALHKFYGYDVIFRDSFLVKLVMRGLKSQLGDQKCQMQPLSVSQMRAIHHSTVRSSLDETLWGVLMLSFRSLLRKSNIVPESTGSMRHVVRRKDVVFSPQGVTIFVRSTKTLQTQEYVLELPINFVKDKVFCAASALQDHIAFAPGPDDGPLFLKQANGRWVPILYKEVLAFIKLGVTNIGLPQHEYGTHSFRRAGAGFLHGIGVPLEDIMSMGDWRSLAVLDYLITPTSRKRDIQERVENSLCG